MKGGFCQVKGKKRTPLAAALINMSLSLFLFASSVFLLAFVMTENDIAPTAYRTAYIAICGLTSLVLSFMNGKLVKIKPLAALAVSFFVSVCFGVLPVLAFCGTELGLSVLILPAACLGGTVIGAAAGRKI